MDVTALFNLSYGLYIASTKDGDRNVGCVVNTVFQITSSPATLAISINKDNFTNPCVLKSGRFAISILTENADRNIISAFGFSSSKDRNKFEGFEYITTENNVPVLTSGVCAYIECKVLNVVDCNTHSLITAEIIDAKNLNAEPPMTYAYYHKVVKGKAPKNAPTHIEPIKTSKNAYVCSVCGYEYTGDDFDSLPESYTCPICNAPKSVFTA